MCLYIYVCVCVFYIDLISAFLLTKIDTPTIRTLEFRHTYIHTCIHTNTHTYRFDQCFFTDKNRYSYHPDTRISTYIHTYIHTNTHTYTDLISAFLLTKTDTPTMRTRAFLSCIVENVSFMSKFKLTGNWSLRYVCVRVYGVALCVCMYVCMYVEVQIERELEPLVHMRACMLRIYMYVCMCMYAEVCGEEQLEPGVYVCVYVRTHLCK